MRKIILYTAASLDGFIAGPDGEIDWLYKEGEFGYEDFYSGIDCVLMGNKTYQVMVDFGVEKFENVHNIVFSRSVLKSKNPDIEFVNDDVAGFCDQLRRKEGKSIWLVGGGEINNILLEHDLVDEIIISYHPFVLGSGIPLFKLPYQARKFRSLNSTIYPEGLLQWHLEFTDELQISSN